jgi:hypothetical protein
VARSASGLRWAGSATGQGKQDAGIGIFFSSIQCEHRDPNEGCVAVAVLCIAFSSYRGCGLGRMMATAALPWLSSSTLGTGPRALLWWRIAQMF